MITSTTELAHKIGDAMILGIRVREARSMVVNAPGHIVLTTEGGVIYEIQIERQMAEPMFCNALYNALRDALRRLFRSPRPLGLAQTI